MRFAILLIVFIYSTMGVAAQRPFTRNFWLNDANIPVRVNAMLQDGYGYLWEGQELVLKGTSATPDVKFLWSGPNGFTDTGSTIYIGSVLEHQRGTYFVSADKNGCLSTGSVTVDIRKMTTAKDINVVLYPSPNDGNFTLDIKTEEEQIIPISIHNPAGQQILELKLPTDKKFLHQQFLLKGRLAGGRYYLTTIVDGKKLTLPFVVDRY